MQVKEKGSRMRRFSLITLALAVVPATAQAPFSDLQSHSSGAKAASVVYLYPEQITVAAEKPSSIDLHFRVADGLHINSHTPRAEELIPTTFKMPETQGVRFTRTVFPAGTDYTLAGDPPEKLSVYTGEFTIHAELMASKGDHLVQATLRYQACSSNTCLPPRSIPVAIDVIAE